jgi:tripartite-type tricarboxylate transporter receptor subunit TctC
MPDVPTSAEAGYPDFLIEFWWGLMAPAGVPPEVLSRLNTELNAVLAESDTRETLERFAAVPTPGSAEQFGKLNAFEITRWSKLIKGAGIKVE